MPLRWAAQYSDRKIMVTLLDHSDDRADGRKFRSALMGEAVRYSSLDVLGLFFERGVRVHALEDELLLHNPVSSSNGPATELLLEHGADVSRLGSTGWTALHMAAGSAGPRVDRTVAGKRS